MFTAEPIVSSDQDLMGRRRYVNEIYKRTVDLWNREKRTVRIGITGTQGCGKTSLINMFKEKVVKSAPETIVIDCYFGMEDNSASIVTSILSSISGGLSSYLHSKPDIMERIYDLLVEFKGSISSAGNAIAAPIGGVIVNAVEYGGKFIKDSKSKSVNEISRQINKNLEDLNRPVIVIFDDFDRLSYDKIKSATDALIYILGKINISCIISYDGIAVESTIQNHYTDKARARDYYVSLVNKLVSERIDIKVGDRSEIQELFIRGMEGLADPLSLPDEWGASERFRAVLGLLVPPFIETARDIISILKEYWYLRSQIMDAVDWVDLLAYSVVTMRMSWCCDVIEKSIDKLVVDPRACSILKVQSNREIGDAISHIFGQSVAKENEKQLLQFLFPRIQLMDQRLDTVERRQELENQISSTSISYRTSLALALGKGKPLGGFDDEYFEEFEYFNWDRKKDEISKALKYHKIDDFLFMIGGYIRRKDETKKLEIISSILRYCINEEMKPVSFHGHRGWFVDAITRWFNEVSVNRVIPMTSVERIIEEQTKKGNLNFVSHLIERDRRIYDQPVEKREVLPTLPPGIASRYSRQISTIAREGLIGREIFNRLYTGSPLMLMVRDNVFDDECQRSVNEYINTDGGRDTFVLLMCGGNFDVDGYYINMMMSNGDLDYFGFFRNRVESICRDFSNGKRHDSVSFAYRRIYERMNEYVVRRSSGILGPVATLSGI